MKDIATPLQSGLYYHIYNRGNNREDLFREERNYRYFLQLYARHVHPFADTFAYCLMRNHFHLLVRVREIVRQPRLKTSQVSETCEVLKPSQHFSNLFNAYSKAINKAYGRTGSLFEERFGRIHVESDAYFKQLVFYIHFNPQRHGFVDDFRDWPWSSFAALRGPAETRLDRDAVWDWFGDATRFVSFHCGQVDEIAIRALIAEDLD